MSSDISTLLGVSETVSFAAASTLHVLESASAGALDGPDEDSSRGVKTSTNALSMEVPTSTIGFFVSTAASAGSPPDSAIVNPTSFHSLNAAVNQQREQTVPYTYPRVRQLSSRDKLSVWRAVNSLTNGRQDRFARSP